jgi:hypothetical protein
MPKPSPRILSLLLVPVLLVSVSCSTDESAFGPSPEPPSQLLSTVVGTTTSTVLGTTSTLVGTATSTLLAAVDLLTCSEQPYAKSAKVVGPEGGTITVGSHSLFIPRGALNRKVQITAEQVRGSTNSVRFAPEGLRFARPAEVTLSYSNCVQLPLKKRVVYTDELLKILQLLPSKDATRSRTVTGKIDHFSRYAVAY